MKNQNGFWRNQFITSQILRVCAKNLEATLLFVDFSREFDSIYQGKMEKIQLTDGLPKEILRDITLYKNTKAKVCTPDGDTDFFDINTGVLQGDTLAPYYFIICQDYCLEHQ